MICAILTKKTTQETHMRNLAALGLTLVVLLSRAELAGALLRIARRLMKGIRMHPWRQQASNEVLGNPAGDEALSNPALLMTADELYARLERGHPRDLVVVEVAPPEDPGAEPPIAGSSRVWRPDYQLPLDGTAQPLDGLVPTAKAFEQLAQSLGVNEDTEVVLVTATSTRGDDTRLWWIFTAFGKRRVFVLDGGFDAWRRCAEAKPEPLVIEPRARGRGTWRAHALDTALLASRHAVVGQRTRLWDVRTPEEHEGRVTMPGAARPGRIPWATRRVEYGMFKRADGTWLSPEGIREVACRELGATPSDGGGAHVFYCQSAVRTTQLIFGMCRAGWPLETLKNYDGSWVEWSHVATEDEVLVAGRGEE